MAPDEQARWREQVRAAKAHLSVADPTLYAAVEDLEPIVLKRPRDPYLALLRAIVGQQLSMKAAASIWARVEARFGAAPEPAVLLAAEDDALRSLGLSRQKAGYVRNVATAAAAGELVRTELERLDDAALIERLTAIKGVGRWTVEMILMFGLHRPDVFSAGDLGVRQAMQAIYGVELTGRPLEVWMTETAAKWSPHRTTACRFLWAWHGRYLGKGS